MFTGIIEHMGTVTAIQPRDPTQSGGSESAGWTMTIGDASPILADCHEGDSISVNGTCVTVISFTSDSFKVGLMPETLRKTNLGDLKVGHLVNLERAVASDTRMGGHFVQGHVDTTATITKVSPDGNALTFELTLPDPELLPYIIPKGYIALDGTSLTVVNVLDKQYAFTISMIVYTQHKVSLARKQVGDKVNVEVDMLGKYVERIISPMISSSSSSALPAILEVYVNRAVDRALGHKSNQ